MQGVKNSLLGHAVQSGVFINPSHLPVQGIGFSSGWLFWRSLSGLDMESANNQLQAFLRFSGSKRKQHVKELEIALDEFRESNVFVEVRVNKNNLK